MSIEKIKALISRQKQRPVKRILSGFSIESWPDSLVKDERNQCLFQWEKRTRSWWTI